MYYETQFPSPIGLLTLMSDGTSLIGLWIEGQKYFRSSLTGLVTDEDDRSEFKAARDWLNDYFAGNNPAASALPLAPIGSEFRLEVWKLLCEIPYGEVTTYGEIARKLAESLHRQTVSARPVGGAIAHNPLSIIIPCHRVIGAKGNLTGYAGGMDKKIWLLTHEGLDMTRMKSGFLS